MKEVDKDGDGKIDSEEIKSMIQTAIQGKREVKLYRYAFMVFITIWIFSLLAIFAVVYGAIQISKDSKVKSSEDPVLITSDGKSIIQTASSDFYVTADGSLKARIDNTSLIVDNSGGTLKVSSTALTASAPLSSDLPDSVFREIKNIGISSSIGASMDLNILGMMRMPATSGSHLGAVTLITHIGRILLEGTSISYFDDNQAELFKSAGFTIATPATGASGRRLLDDVQSVMGTFNAVPVVTSTTVENVTSAFTLLTPTIPSNFVMTALHLTPCVNNPAADGNIVNYNYAYLGGALPTAVGIDFCDLLDISDDYIVYLEDDADTRYLGMKYTMYRMGEEYLRVEYVHPLEPEFAFVQVFNRSSPGNGIDFQYQVDASSMGFQIQQMEGTPSTVNLAGPLFHYGISDNSNRNMMQEALLSKFNYLGETKLGDEAVRVWAMHLAENDIHAYWYDAVNGQSLKRINFGSFGMLQVDSFTQLESGVDLEFLFQQPSKESLRLPKDIEVPPRVVADAFFPFIEDYKDYLRWQTLSKPVNPDATSSPSAIPTYRPTRTPRPSAKPTAVPTEVPTAVPTISPTAVPTQQPTLSPSAVPTLSPTDVPSHSPSEYPTSHPSISSAPATVNRRMMDKSAPAANLRVTRPKLVEVKQDLEGKKKSKQENVKPWKRPVVYRHKESKPMEVSTTATAVNFFDGNWNGLNVVEEQVVGCAATNVCPKEFNFTSDGYTFAEIPGLIFTPLKNMEVSHPCLFTANVVAANSKRRLLEANGASVIDFSVAGDLNLYFCKNLKGMSDVNGNPTIEFDYGLGANEFTTSMQKLFGFSAQRVNFLKTTDVTEMPTFDIENGQVVFNDAGLGEQLLFKLQDLASSNLARTNSIRQCLKKNLPRDEIRFDVVGAQIDGTQFISDFGAFASILRNSHFVTNVEWEWHPYFCGLSGETRTISITFTVDLFFSQYSTTIYTNTEELVRFFESGMPIASKKLLEETLISELNTEYAALLDTLLAKKTLSSRLWSDIEGISSKLSSVVQDFKRLNLASNPRYAAVTEVLKPSLFAKTGSSVSALFEDSNPLAQVYQLERASTVIDSIMLDGWGCQFTNSLDPRDIQVSRKIVDACATNTCDNKAYSFGTWTEAVSSTYQCYVSFDGSFNANSKSKYVAAWKKWQETSSQGRMVNPQSPSTWLTKSMTTLRSNILGEENDYIRSFIFCASGSPSDDTVQRFASDVLARSRLFSSSEELNIAVPLAATYGMELLTSSSCYAEDFSYVPSKLAPPGVISPMEVNNVFVGSFGNQWLGNLQPDSVGKMSFTSCDGTKCDASTVQKFGEYRDSMDNDKVHQCYAGIDGEFKNLDVKATFIKAFETFASSRHHGVWWDQYGWVTNTFTTIRSDVSWMNVFIFCADGSGDINGVGSKVLQKLRESQSTSVFQNNFHDLSLFINQHGLEWINAESLANFDQKFRLDRPLHLIKNNFVGGHGCQWIDTFIPVNPEAEKWDISTFVPRLCTTESGCDRFSAQYLVSYNKLGASNAISCFAAFDGYAASNAEYASLQATLSAYNIQEGEGYWLGGDSYDGKVDGYYMNSFWNVRSPSQSGSGWLNVFTWCSDAGNANGFGGAVLSLLRNNGNDYEAAENQLGALANKYGVGLNFDKACFSASNSNMIDQPLKGVVSNGFIGGHGCQNIKQIVPFSNGASVISTTFWESCNSTSCSNPLKVTNIGSVEDSSVTYSCYVIYDGNYGTNLTTGTAGEAMRRFMSQPGSGYWTISSDNIINSFLTVQNSGKADEWVNVYAFCSTGGDPFNYARQVMTSLRQNDLNFKATSTALSTLAATYAVNLYAPGDCSLSQV